ncbi:hypothetical protein [Hoylesella timonensis]|nr:hypothetical protein [Hoylesella timonensis]
MKKSYVTPSILLLPMQMVGPNIGSGKGDAELQPELTPGEREDLETGGGW